MYLFEFMGWVCCMIECINEGR